MSTTEQPMEPPFLEPGGATINDLEVLDIRIGRVLDARPLEGAESQPVRCVSTLGRPGQRVG